MDPDAAFFFGLGPCGALHACSAVVMSADTWLLATFAVLAVLPFFILPYLLPSHVFYAPGYSLSSQNGCSLDELAEFLNRLDWRKYRLLASKEVSCTTRLALYGQFLRELTPYLIEEPHAPFRTQERPTSFPNAVDCTDPRWAGVLTGRLAPRRHQVLYFVPIGFNVRLLEVLLYELYDVVDWFVMYESDVTQIGVTKELLYNATKRRWAQFQDKIIHLSGTWDPALTKRVRESTCSSIIASKRDWTLERGMREAPVRQFKAIRHAYPLDSPDEVIAIGADADEIPSAEAVWRLSRCDFRPPANLSTHIVYFGTLMAKSSLDTLQILRDGRCSSGSQGPWGLTPYVWGAGPVALTLDRVLAEGAIPRVYPRDIGCRTHFDYSSAFVIHLPVGSAVHLSTTREPVMQLFKEAGTMEALESYDSMSVLPLLRAGLAGFVPMTLLREMVSQQAVLTIPVAQMPRSLQEVWFQALPWVIRENPERYCFEVPEGLPSHRDSRCRSLWPCLHDLHFAAH